MIKKIKKEIKARLRLVFNAIRVACSKPKLEMTDSMIVAQWVKYNRSFAVTRSVNHLLGLLVGQIAIIKNEEPRLRVSNQKFVDWVASGLNDSLKVNSKNTPPYAYLHTRQVKMRPRRKYRQSLDKTKASI